MIPSIPIFFHSLIQASTIASKNLLTASRADTHLSGKGDKCKSLCLLYLLCGEGFCYHGGMREFFKNPWVWLLILFVLVSGGIGAFLFRDGSARVVENDVPASSADAANETLSKEDSESIVKKLESGSMTPGETESDADATDMPGGTPVGEAASSAPSASIQKASSSPEAKTATKKVSDVSEDTDSEKNFSIENRLVSWGFSKANERTIDTVVIHSTYNATGGDPFSVSKILDIYKSYGVSPHYLVARDGTVYRLVDEKNIAYHAGESKMSDGRTNVNAFSIGIEVIGKDDGGPTEAQYVSVEKLLADIGTRWDIKHVLGHSDIAPGRKSDPWGFEWKKIGGKKL